LRQAYDYWQDQPGNYYQMKMFINYFKSHPLLSASYFIHQHFHSRRPVRRLVSVS